MALIIFELAFCGDLGQHQVAPSRKHGRFESSLMANERYKEGKPSWQRQGTPVRHAQSSRLALGPGTRLVELQIVSPALAMEVRDQCVTNVASYSFFKF